MSAEVIKLYPARPVRESCPRKPVNIIDQAHREAYDAGSTQDLSRFPVLGMLAWLAKVASPRARSVEWSGVRFPLSHGLWARVVVCPRTGRRLVGTVTL